MKLEINESNCIGCGLCPQIAEGFFRMEGDVAEVIQSTVPEEDEEKVREAADSCPTDAIIID